MQIFNQINSRKLNDEWNVFSNFFNNWMFQAVLIFEFVVQLLFGQYGGPAVRCWPLTWGQLGFCLAVGAGGLIWSFVIKLAVSALYFKDVKLNEEPLTDIDRKNSLGNLRS